KLNLTTSAKKPTSHFTFSMKNYFIQPFNVSGNSFGNELNCASSGMPSYIPVIVGAILAGLVVLVLIAYVIGRFRSRKREQTYERLN
ncbi:EGFR-like transmembrane domain-containing protein, partial [Salmonella sp. s54836]|uniref:EGFR-like transmembrane domain-containing protein n=1 Tax=Salmonella sp. s54836 TaxID=3159673 RepID=UPI0039818169